MRVLQKVLFSFLENKKREKESKKTNLFWCAVFFHNTHFYQLIIVPAYLPVRLITPFNKNRIKVQMSNIVFRKIYDKCTNIDYSYQSCMTMSVHHYSKMKNLERSSVSLSMSVTHFYKCVVIEFHHRKVKKLISF